MLKNVQIYFKKFAVFHTARFLKYVWPFLNIVNERVSPLHNTDLFLYPLKISVKQMVVW